MLNKQLHEFMSENQKHSHTQLITTNAANPNFSYSVFDHPIGGPIARKLVQNQRLTEDDCLTLFKLRDLWVLAELVRLARQQRQGVHATTATYVLNQVIHYTNICIGGCKFCSFARPPGHPQGYALTLDQIIDQVKRATAIGCTELHIVGGLNPLLPYEFYLKLLAMLRDAFPGLHLKCFTAPEIAHFARISGKSIPRILEELRHAGMDSMAGGGAEIFSPETRSKIAPNKISGEEYLQIHTAWHKLGGKSTCTMLYGHIESITDRINHLRLLREQQDITGGFLAFIPLPFCPGNGKLGLTHGPSGWDTLRTISIARLYLDNIDHITAYWVGLGLKTAQMALIYGSDDLGGTVITEHVFQMANAPSPQALDEYTLARLIREAGYTPIQRDSFFRPIKTASV